MVLDSRIIICKGMKMDRKYEHVLNYTPSELLAVCNSNPHFVASSSTYSFIRDDGSISTDFSYSQALQCNYVAFQNTDYDGRWFFGWIDRIEYKGERNIRIHYTVDFWSTWFSELVLQPVFVEREHVNDDTFGIHTVAEPISSMQVQEQYIQQIKFNDYIIAISFIPDTLTRPRMIGSYYNTCTTRCYHSGTPAEMESAMSLIKSSIADGTFINAILYPTRFCGRVDSTLVEQVETETYTFRTPTDLHGYVPVNNKMFTSPYSYILINNCTNQILLNYENFNDFNNLQFTVRGFASPLGELTLYPRGYNTLSTSPYKSITIKDFPQLPVNADSYDAWIAQKSNSALLSSMASAVSGAVMGMSAGGVPGAVAGGMIGAVGNFAVSAQQAMDAPDSIRGGMSSGILDCAMSDKGFYVCGMSLKADVAKTIDEFFSKEGYQVNIIKVPNITGRQYWNYVKINGNAGYGDMPENAREQINAIMNKGVTVWHNEGSMGNYYVGGAKMENPITS